MNVCGLGLCRDYLGTNLLRVITIARGDDDDVNQQFEMT
jgi:hypothetical protein